MSVDPVAQLLSDPRFKGQPITWGGHVRGLRFTSSFGLKVPCWSFRGEPIKVSLSPLPCTVQNGEWAKS
jgi:hypothetical protein